MSNPYPPSWPKPAPLSRFGYFTRLHVKQKAFVICVVGINHMGHICDNLCDPTVTPLFAIELETWDHATILTQPSMSGVKLIFTDGEVYWGWRLRSATMDILFGGWVYPNFGPNGKGGLYWGQLDNPTNPSPSYSGSRIPKVFKKIVREAIARYASRA